MIAQVAVDGRTLNEPGDGTSQFATHRRIVENFRKFGMLRLLGPGDFDDLFNFIEGANDSVKSLWIHLLKDLAPSRTLRETASPLDLSTRQYLESGKLPEGFERLVDVVLASDSQKVTAGWPKRTELAPLSMFDLSETMTQFRDLRSDETEAQGTPREDLWNRRLRRLARLSSEVWVFDPYLFRASHFTEQEAPSRLAHLDWLIRKLAGNLVSRDNLPQRVHLLAAKGEFSPDIAATFLKRIVMQLSSPVTVDFTLYSPGDGFRPHDRHIRFSCGAAFKVHAGFDRLRFKRVKDAEGYTWNFVGLGPSLDQLVLTEQAVQSRGTTTSVTTATPSTD